MQEAARRRAASAAARWARGVIRDPRADRSARGVTRDRRRARPASPEYPPSRRRVVAVESCHKSWSTSWHVDSEGGRGPPLYRSGLPAGHHPLLPVRVFHPLLWLLPGVPPGRPDRRRLGLV